MIYIIAHKDEKAAIMRSINEQAGPGTSGRDLLLAADLVRRRPACTGG